MKSISWSFNIFSFSATKKGNELGPLAEFGKILVGFIRPFASRHVKYSSKNFKWNNPAQDETPDYQSLPRNYLITEDNEPPPEIRYNYLSRTREDNPCEGEYEYMCNKAMEDGRVVNCSLSRFR